MTKSVVGLRCVVRCLEIRMNSKKENLQNSEKFGKNERKMFKFLTSVV